jgi:hypothetical protein
MSCLLIKQIIDFKWNFAKIAYDLKRYEPPVDIPICNIGEYFSNRNHIIVLNDSVEEFLNGDSATGEYFFGADKTGGKNKCRFFFTDKGTRNLFALTFMGNI